MQKADLGSVALIAAAAAGCYASSLHNGFVFDDSAYLTSPVVLRFGLADAFLQNWLQLDIFRPIALLSLALDYLLYQEGSAGYHLSSLLLHLANGLLLYGLASVLLAHRGAALAGALFYVVHPLQTEVVGWISARADLLMSLFFLVGILGHVRAESTGARRWHLLACVSFAGSLLAKESGIVLPAVLWWHDVCSECPSRQLSSLTAFTLTWLKRCCGYVLVLGIILIWRWVVVGVGTAEGGPASANFLADAALWPRLLTIASVFLRYLILIVSPLRLCADYSYASIPLATSLLDPWALGGLLAGLALLCLPPRLGTRACTFAWGFLWLALLPVSNLLFLAPSGMAERYLHLAMIPLALFCGLVVRAWQGNAVYLRRRYAGIALGALVLAFLAVRTVQRLPDWRSDFSLFSAVLRHYPNNARAHENLGHALYQRGQPDRAVEHYKVAIAIRPTRVRAHYSLGLLYSELQRYGEALPAFEAALRLNPSHVDSHYNLGLAYHRMKRYQEAIHQYERALRLAPDHLRAAYNLARAHDRAGQYAQAIGQYRAAIGLDASMANAHYYLGDLYYRLGRVREMARAWTVLLELAPDHVSARRIRALLGEADDSR